MENFKVGGEEVKKTFFNTVFSNTEEDKAEIMNIVQYSLLGIIPIVILNKLIQRFIPEADVEKSSLELLAEIFFQIIIIFCGIIIIHRAISYLPTYSGFKYENLSLTNVVLAFLVIVLSIQTKLGLKINILFDRISDLWNGTSESDTSNKKKKKSVKFNNQVSHSPSQADYLDNPSVQQGVFPPAPTATSKNESSGYDLMMGGGSMSNDFASSLMPANSVLGGSFGSFF
jgi:hypothetical protein